MVDPVDKTVAFQVLLPAPMLAAVKRQCAQLQVNSVGAYLRQLIAAELAKESIDAWGAEEVPSDAMRATWEASKFGEGHFLLQAVAPPSNGFLTVRVRWRRNGGRGHTNYLDAAALASEFPIIGKEARNRRVLYLRGGVYGVVTSIMGYAGGAHVTLSLNNVHPTL